MDTGVRWNIFILLCILLRGLFSLDKNNFWEGKTLWWFFVKVVEVLSFISQTKSLQFSKVLLKF